MLGLLGSAVYLGGSLVIVWLLLLPVAFLLLVSILYIVADAIRGFRERRGAG